MKHIAFHINSLMKGGIERVLIQQLKALDRTQFRVSLFISYKYDELEVLRPEIPSDVKVVHLLDQPWLYKTRLLKAKSKMPKYLKLYDEVLQTPRKWVIRSKLKALLKDVDTIVDFDSTIGSYLKEFKGLRVGWFHFSMKHYHRGIKYRQWRLGLKFKNYDKLVLISDAMKAEAQEMYPEHIHRFVRMYNVFDFSYLKEKSLRTTDLTQAHQSLLRSKYILAAGRFDERQKDFSTLIKAYGKAKSTKKPDLVIIGEGPDKSKLMALAVENKMAEKIHFVGFQENPFVWFGHCQFFVHSSQFEGLPTVLIEALALGKLVIATDCPTGPFEILKGGRCGVLVPLKDVDALAKALDDVLSERIKYTDFPEIEEHIKQFDLKYVGPTLAALYDPNSLAKESIR